MASSIEHIQQKELAASVRDKLNRVIDAANSVNNNLTTDCPPQCPPGPAGKDGLKGDPGNYNGVQITETLASVDELPNTGFSGDAYLIQNGDSVDLYLWAPLANGTTNGWRNYGPLNDTNYRNVAHCIYVSPDGNDDYDGRTYGKAVKTLEAACQAATELGGKTTVFVYPGDYEIEGEIPWPDLCTVFGIAGARKTTIKPKNEQVPDGDIPYRYRNAFLLGDGGYVEGFSFEGFQVFSGFDNAAYLGNLTPFDNPTGGFAIAFRPGALINRVPYAHNITVYQRFPPRNLISSPMERKRGNPLVGPGGGVAIADGSVVNPYSAFPNIMTWGATPSSPNGIGYLATKGALLNPVNAVALWAHKHYMCTHGAQMVMSSCSSQFGDYSLWSEGFNYSIKPEELNEDEITPSVFAADIIRAKTDDIINDMWLGTVSRTQNNPCGCICNPTEYEAHMRKDLAYALRAIAFSVQTGDHRPVQQFIRGLFDWQAEFVTTLDDRCELVWANWFLLLPGADRFVYGQSLADYINSYLSRLEDRKTVTELCRTIQQTILKREKRLERSLITAINHQWTYPLAGVTKDSVPARFKNNGYSYAIKRSIVQRNGGRIRFSGQDDEGNAVFVGGLEIEARSGELRGPPFDAAVRKRATRITFARSFF